ncbi:MAG: thiamine-binding protein [Anaerolineales bacterium]|nr:thiamine-binding protein [Anaerolineales bacterium]
MSDDLLNRNELISVQQQVALVRQECLANEVPFSILHQLDELDTVLERSLEEIEGDPVLTAQVSLYPLGQELLSPVIHEALNDIEKHGLEVVTGAMSTLIAGAESSLWKALKSAFQVAAKHGKTVMIITVSNACPSPFQHDDISW